jgi:hypothetical protein
LSRAAELRITWTASELSDRIRLYEQVYGLFTPTGEQEREDLGYIIRVATFLRDNM